MKSGPPSGGPLFVWVDPPLDGQRAVGREIVNVPDVSVPVEDAAVGLVDPQVAADAQPVLQRLRKDDLVLFNVVDVRA